MFSLLHPAFITSAMISWPYGSNETGSSCIRCNDQNYTKILERTKYASNSLSESGWDFFWLLNWILITKDGKNTATLANRQMCFLFACIWMNWNYIRCIFWGERERKKESAMHKNMKLKKKLIKSKAEKNWDVDKTKAQQKKPGGKICQRKRRNTIIYVVLEKVFWRSRVRKQFLAAKWWMKREKLRKRQKHSLMDFFFVSKIYDLISFW